MKEIPKELSDLLIPWFLINKRYMPWRENPSPYHVWVSEIMLQQTRVDTVMPYYEKFMEALPDLGALAVVSEDHLLKLWEGLGYYNRVKNMQKAARICVEKYAGDLPDSFENLLSLPGIGSYTAGAISSIAFLKPEPVVDGNVLRVLSRVLGFYDAIDEPKTKKELEESLRDYLKKSGFNPSFFNQGLMECGALVCVPNGAPKCAQCPFRAICTACKQHLVDELPVQHEKRPRKIQFYNVLFLYDQTGSVVVEKRPSEGLLSTLYGFPMVEKTEKEDLVETVRSLGFAPIKGKNCQYLSTKKHIFTHVEWHMDGVLMQVETSEIGAPYMKVPIQELSSYAFPTAFKKWEFEKIFKDLI